MSGLRKSYGAARSHSGGSVVVLVDPFWVGNLALSKANLHHIEKVASQWGSLLRIYWYVDNYTKELEGFEAKQTMIRVLGRDDLEDGFELIKAIDSDLDYLSSQNTVSTFVLASLDDRLLLSVERVKQRGFKVIGLVPSDSKGDEGSVRMMRSFDDAVQLSQNVESDREVGPDEEAVLSGVVGEWMPAQEEASLDYIRQYISSRPGIPREIDSRLLFLSSRALNRELTNSEKIFVRNLVRTTVSIPQ